MTSVRVMDDQKEKIERLSTLYSNFKKESIPRRTVERRDLYEYDRAALWKSIEENHKVLIDAGAPKEYKDKFADAMEVNAKFYEKLKTWAVTKGGTATPTSVSSANNPPGEGTSTATEEDVLNEEQSTFPPLSQAQLPLVSSAQIIPTQIPAHVSMAAPQPIAQQRQGILRPSTFQPSSTVPQPVLVQRQENLGLQTLSSAVPQPLGIRRIDNTTIRSSSTISQQVPENRQMELQPTSSNSTTSSQSYETRQIPQQHNPPTQWQPMSSLSWNEEVEQQELTPSNNIEKILLMLAKNQLANSRMKPPTKKIQPFDGNPKTYRAFKNSFARSIQNETWNQIELFDYLLAFLTGEPYSIISNLEVTEHSYTIAWNMLEQRYNNPRKQLESVIQLLRDDKFKTSACDVNSFSAFVNTYQTALANIKQMDVTMEDVLMEFILPRIDYDSKGRFEDFIGMSNQTPTFQQLDKFFEKESIVWRNKPKNPQAKSKNHPNTSKVLVTTSTEDTKQECFICNKNHTVVECDEFLTSNDRERLLKKNYVCIFCVEHKYNRKSPCRKKKSLKCGKCNGQHITLMHRLGDKVGESTMVNEAGAADEINTYLTQDDATSYSVLPTAIANVLDSNGQKYLVRCLVDICAERSYVCEDLVQKLRLKKNKTGIIIRGINGLTGKVTSSVKLVIQLDDPSLPNVETEALVVPKVTGKLPAIAVYSQLNDFDGTLADPYFDKPSFVGVLLGGDVAGQIFKKDVPNHITESGLLLQPTHFGWIISGSSTRTSNFVSTFVTLNESLVKTTEDEEMAKRILDFYEIPEKEDHSDEHGDDYCEILYQEKHYRLSDGRYVVPVPWKVNSPQLGHSYRKALRLLKLQETKWEKDKQHYDMSNDFMIEYEVLGHMTRINTEHEKIDSGDVYYVPYISILRISSLTTKLRNVFNASMPSSNGISLNDLMWEGKKLQTNIKDILLTARSFVVVYSADVSMMFRQIFVIPEDRDKLRIIWRPTKDEAPREYRLNTITYGTDAAPFLAIRTLIQCAKDNAPSEEIQSIIRKGFYMDDLLYGADSIEECQRHISDIKATLAAGKFPLTKWMSNKEDALANIPPRDKISSLLEDNCKTIKILGASYNFQDDEFQLNFRQPAKVTPTKRGISSAAASFYDPLGFILPFIMMLRIFLQTVWKHKIDWDEHIGTALTLQFQRCIQGVEFLNRIKIPRHIPADKENTVEFIGFSDASSHAQAAVIYSRIKTCDGYRISLVTSKGNVAKLKTSAVIESKQNTIPKLELQALVTLAELFENLKECFCQRKLKFTAYTDSQVVLAWIRSRKDNGTRYVSKRVDKIKGVISPEALHYVRSEENPADPASRGLTADQLSSCDLWFKGPHWLQLEELPTTPFEKDTSAFLTESCEPDEDMFCKYSKWEKVLRIAAYILKWKQLKGSPYLKGADIKDAKIKVIKYYQKLELTEVYNSLQHGKYLSKRHWLYKLSPFLDKEGIIRVGGRLDNAHCIPETQRHPIVIPKGKCLNLLIEFTHRTHSHANNTLMLRLLTEEYWIPGVRKAVKNHIYKCVKCIRWNAKVRQPEMGQLPEERVTPSVTFEKVGVDLCGPFSIKASPLRFDRSLKVWVVCFVCLVTKAVHLDLVSSLSTEHFLAAFSRFCSRRGTSSEVWSDNGTNFVGANRLLKETWEKLIKSCEEQTAMQEVTWKFIPRHSPTFGGLWEACVKSLKYFVKRMADVKNLTFEEFQTLLCRIEALLNSRPLCSNPLTPHEPAALTPFHFINQRGYKPTVIDGKEKVPLTKKWLMIHQITQQIWERFLSECLREMQIKAKWVRPQPNLEVNDIVVIKEPSTTPGEWKMGQVTKTYADPRGTVRKVDVYTPAKETTLHAVNRLVPLLPDPHYEPSNQVKTRSGRKAKTISALNICMIVLFAIFPMSNAEAVEQLEPGLHLRHLGKLHQKAFTMEFTVTTNINITDDIININNYAAEFSTECIKLGQQYNGIHQQCSTLNSSVHELTSQITSELNIHFPNRKKRWIGISTKTLWKVAPVLITSAGMIYQEAEIVNLKSQLSDTRQKMRTTANALLKVNNLEFEEIEGKLNEVIQQQQELQAEEAVTDYSQTIIILLNKIKAKYENSNSIHPLQELEKYMEPLQHKMPNIGIPTIGEKIFSIYPVVRSRVNDFMVVTFMIPIVNLPPLDHWAIIRVPNSTGQTWMINNSKKKVQRIVTHTSTKRYAEVSETSFITPDLIENISMVQIDACMESIINNDSYVQCREDFSQQDSDEIIPMWHTKAVIFTSGTRSSQIFCNNKSTIITSTAAIFDSLDCQAKPVSINIMQEVEPLPHLLTLSTIDPLTVNPEIDTLQQEVRSQWNLDYTNIDSTTVLGITLITTTVVVFFAISMKCFFSNLNSQQWVPHWEGPHRDI